MIDKNVWVTDSSLFGDRLTKWQKTVNIMADIFSAPGGFIVQYTDEGYQVVVASDNQDNPYPAMGGIIPEATNIFCRKVVGEGHTLYVRNATQLEEWLDNPEVTDDGFNSYLGLPLIWPDGTPFGTICVMDYQITDYQETYIGLMEQFRDLVCTDLELLFQYLSMQELSLKDHLSECFNRRGFMTLGETALQLAKRNKKNIAMLFFDLDNLKLINDTHGHEAGDDAIAAFAKILMSSVREVDVVARMGGDEFAVLAMVNDESEVSLLIERIRDDLSKLQMMFALTTSCGSQYYPHDKLVPLEDMLKEVDHKMYLDKSQKKQL